MNYFPFDACPRASAIALDDKRLPRVFGEAVMVLSRVQFELTGIAGPYSPRVPVPKALLDWAKGEGEGWFVEWVQGMRDALIARYGRERVEGYSGHAAYMTLHDRFLDDRPFDARPTSFPNLARAAIKGLDYTHEPDTHLAYRNYMSAQWQGIDKRPCVWTTHGRPVWAVDILPQGIMEFLGV